MNIDIWRLTEKYEDLHQIEPIKATFRSRHTQLLSKEMMDIIEGNGPFLRSLKELVNILQGDDPVYPASLLQTSLDGSELDDARFVTEVLKLPYSWTYFIGNECIIE